MEEQKFQEDSLSNIKIYKPKAIRKCKKSKNCLKSSISSKDSKDSTNSKKSEEIKIFDGECTNIDLENINIDEINLDFYMYKQKSDEFECYNELSDIINSSKVIKKQKKIKKIKRCKNPKISQIKMMESSYFNESIIDIKTFSNNNNSEES